ncbi:DUF3187 domain-containing protein [Sulfurimonas sp.]|uniref:DUF3187 domain-containing protein n=1 Tax=Sulfurimonas sp. TaxID=2022749 RepID=UPI00356B257B
MNKTLLLLLTLSVSLLAYSDSDMDGVDDKLDQCPNTPFSELVDINGCTTKYLESPHHFDIILGIDYSQKSYTTLEDTDVTSKSIQMDYYYKNFSLQAATSYYNSDSIIYSSDGMNDSFLGAYYKLNPVENLSVRLGVGVILPTYDTDLNNNNTDYTSSLSLSYMLDNVNIFGGYSYTIINDDDIKTVTPILYQNTNSYNAGVGFYPSSKVYVSASYNSSDSIYKGIDDIDTASFYLFYSIDSNWFTTLNYAYGLSDTASDNYAAVKIGYYF